MEDDGTKKKIMSHIKKSVPDILRATMPEFAESDKGVHERIIDLADAGFFEEHQTSSSLRVTADGLLSILLEGKGESESK